MALRNIDLRETANALSRVNVLILCAAIASYVFSIAAKAARWQLLLTVHKSPSFGRAFSILSIGQMMNAFIPAHLGEFARAYLMGEAEADSKVYVLGTVVVERIADLFMLWASLTILLSQMALPDWLASPARGTSLVMAFLIPFFVFLAWQRNFVLRMTERASHLFPLPWREWLVRQVHSGLASSGCGSSPAFIGRLDHLVSDYLSGQCPHQLPGIPALGLSLPFWASLLLLVVLQVGTEVPSSPGGIGVFQYLVILTLAFYAVDKNVALAYSVLLYLVIYVPIALIGVYCLWREKITWKKLDEAAAMLKRLRSRAAK